MAQSIITKAFETYKAQQEAIASPVELDEFVLALVPGQDANAPIDRDETMPSAAQIVYRSTVTQHGFVGPNSVVYSLIMDTRVGDFEFNWVGLRSKSHNVLAAIMHIPTIAKFESIPGVQNGNSVTRSVLMNYQDAKQATGITVGASTWQIDFTSRLFGMDEAERLANIDVFGHAAFLGDGFKITKSGSHYLAKAGCGYVGGLRCHLDAGMTLTNVINSSGVYLDASWQGGPLSQWHTQVEIKASKSTLSDYVDGDGYQHYVTKIADINSAGAITDRRYLEGFEQYYQQYEVNERLEEKIDKLSITDSVSSVSRVLVASAKGLKTAYDKGVAALNRANAAYDLAASKWVHRAGTTAQTGTVQLSTSVSSESTTLASTPSAVRSAYNKAVEALNKANAKWSYVQASLTVYGATKLSSAVNSTSETLAATPKAVKIAYDKGVAAYNLAASKMTQATADGRYWKRTETVTNSTKLDNKTYSQLYTAIRAGLSPNTNTWRSISDVVNSNSSDISASLRAVKTAYDKGVSAYNLAASKMTQATADGRYWKRTETVTNSTKLDNKTYSQLYTAIRQGLSPNTNTWRSISDVVNSTSSVISASSKAVKTAHDKAALAYNQATEALSIAHSKWTHRSATTAQSGTVQLSTSVSSQSAAR
ncbi:tail fiber protein, partial [Vibrio cortegadensis]|uniref:tail fiber protein n=1 Tax=Vibrio cortegadensis TaxID=1328770 RepID=UPI0025B46BDC